jgi:hypothetical protein
VKRLHAFGLEWSLAGMLFGLLAALTWVPVQLLSPPEPDFAGSVIVSAGLAIIAIPGFALAIPLACRGMARRNSPWTHRRALIGLGVAVFVAAAGWGVFPFILTREVGLALRLGIPRAAYVLILGYAYIRLIERECR